VSTIIRGHSDDIISIESDDWSEEVYAPGEEGVLSLSTGDIIDFTYDGCWRFDLIHSTSPYPANIRKCPGDPESDDYTDIVTLHGNAVWALGVNHSDAELGAKR